MARRWNSPIGQLGCIPSPVVETPYFIKSPSNYKELERTPPMKEMMDKLKRYRC
jgi:hypothetical protein